MLILSSSLSVTLSETFSICIFCKHVLQPLISLVNTENVEWYRLKSSFQGPTYMPNRKSEIRTVWVQVFKQFCIYWSWPNSDLGKPKYSFPILYGYSTWSMIFKKNFPRGKICHYCCFLPIHHTTYSESKKIRFRSSFGSSCFWESVLTVSHHNITYYIFINVSYSFIAYNFVLCESISVSFFSHKVKLDWCIILQNVTHKESIKSSGIFLLSNTGMYNQWNYFCDLSYVTELW